MSTAPTSSSRLRAIMTFVCERSVSSPISATRNGSVGVLDRFGHPGHVLGIDLTAARQEAS